MAGRPRKYKTAKALQSAIDRFFQSISRTVAARDEAGEVILNDNGEEIYLTEYIRPPSISAMCLFLGIDRSTWQNYCDKELYPEFFRTTMRTRARIECYLEEQLITRQKSVQGIIFNLQNNYGWKEKRELELGEATRKDMAGGDMSLQEKLELIAQAARGFSIDGYKEEGKEVGADGQQDNRED